MILHGENALRHLGWILNEYTERWKLYDKEGKVDAWINRQLIIKQPELFSCEIDDVYNFGNGPVPAHQHYNGGGWVADTAKVADTVFIGLNAEVFGNAQVRGNVQIHDRVKVYDNALIHGHVSLYNNVRVYDNAYIQDNIILTDSVNVHDNAKIINGPKIYGNVEIKGNVLIKGNIHINNNDNNKIPMLSDAEIRGHIIIRNKYIIIK